MDKDLQSLFPRLLSRLSLSLSLPPAPPCLSYLQLSSLPLMQGQAAMLTFKAPYNRNSLICSADTYLWALWSTQRQQLPTRLLWQRWHSNWALSPKEA